MEEAKIVSVFDGMACGMLAMMEAGVKVGRYVAYEIDKYAVQTSSHNFPEIEHRGDVFQADFTEFEGFDWLVGGSPCTYWSIAQKNNRETVASGLGWELFCQYVRALREVKPKFFIYENNKSMSKAIRESITETFGFEPICINSALVSAQNRQRLYWVGKRNDDGSYSKVNVKQPEDRGILLKDVLDGVAWMDKSYTIDSNYHKTLGQQGFDRQSGRRKMAAEPVNMTEAGKPLTEREMEYMVRSTNGKYSDRWAYLQKPGEKDKAMCITANISKGVPYNICAEPVCMRYERSEEAKAVRKQYEAGEIHHGFRELHELHPRTDGKTNTLSTVLKDNPICEPARVGTWPNTAKNQEHDSQQYRIYSTDGKSVTQCGNGGGLGAKTGLYAIHVEFEGDRFIKAVSGTDGKEPPVYEVKDGFITIKGKKHAIKLADGYWIIRKLTVSECKRLQTVPEWYEFPVSDTQAYKMLGNGWTVSVISHLIRACLEEVGDEG